MARLRDEDRLIEAKPLAALRSFLDSEATAGIILMGVAAAALVVANSPLATFYFGALETKVLGLSVLYWINDALMAIFFLVVGLEIKSEILDGQLSTWPRRALPGIGAIGGMIVPALIYVSFNAHSPGSLRGWAIPAATDIAFALGILALLGDRVPTSLKVFLAALAILDDLGAVAIIALFYTGELLPTMLAAALACIVVLALINWAGVRVLWPYLAIGALLWFFILKSGIHATLAGVALAFTIPLNAPPGGEEIGGSPLHRLENTLQPWVAFFIVPVFGFANAGVSFSGLSPDVLLTPIPLGVALGLFIGKQVGVYLPCWAAIRMGFADMPAGASRAQVYGVSVLCGVGFTMSLFIGALAFPNRPELIEASKIGILVGSALSALLGFLVLRFAPRGSALGQARSAATM